MLKDAGAFKKPKDSADYGFLAPAFIYICSRQLRFVSRIRAHHGCKTVHSYSKFYISAVEGLIYSASIPPATNPNDAPFSLSYFAFPKRTAINNFAISLCSNFLIRFLIKKKLTLSNISVTQMTHLSKKHRKFEFLHIISKYAKILFRSFSRCLRSSGL